MVRSHRSPTDRTGTRGRPGRPAVAALVLALVASLAGLAPLGAVSAETRAVPILTFVPPINSMRLPATIRASATVSSTEAMAGRLTLSLYPPKVGPAAPCSNTPFAVESVKVEGTSAGVALAEALKVTDPEGIWYTQASYSPAPDQPAVTSKCAETLILAPDSDWDPDGPPDSSWAPFTTPQALVSQQYRDILGRAPSADEQADWVARLMARETTRGDLVATLRASADNTTNVDPVARLYKAYFLRTPEPGGLGYWITARRGGRSLLSISEFFAQSPEFRDRYGSLTNAEFVNLVYLNVLGRAGDQGGVAFWNDQLDRGVRSRGNLMTGFSESPEYVARQQHHVTVAVLFVFMLGRAPTPDELTAYVEVLTVGADAPLPYTVASFAEEIMRSAEYARRV